MPPCGLPPECSTPSSTISSGWYGNVTYRRELHRSFHPKMLTRKPWVWCRTKDYYRRDIADHFEKWHVLTHWQYIMGVSWINTKPQVIGWFSTEDDEYTWYPERNPFSIFILPSDINSSYSHRSDLGHSSRLHFSLATLDVGNMFGECGLRFGAEMVNSDDILNQFMHQCG